MHPLSNFTETLPLLYFSFTAANYNYPQDRKILSATKSCLGGLKNKKNTYDHSCNDLDICSDTFYRLRRAKQDLKISD